jgi:hypothetical protein
MNFKELTNLIEQKRSTADSFRTTGDAMASDKIKSSSTMSSKQKDAERKRRERAKQVPRERKSKEELIREVIAVKTASGRIQLIFKDSFDKSKHTRLSKTEVMSMEEARTLTKDPNFEQTGASKLLFGNVREKDKSEKGKVSGGEEEEQKQQRRAPSEEGAKETTSKSSKPKKLSKDEIFDLMTQMTPEQLNSIPFEMRQEYFKKLRNPPTNSSFDSMTFEMIANKFGINPLSTSSYNQQVLNALIFLAKIKAGAGEQELESYRSLAPNALDFSKNAFEQAKKILSQIGEECIQNLVASVESGSKTIFAEGNVDMECGKYKFNISAGGEFSLTTDKFDQSSKSFRGLIKNSIATALATTDLQKDPKFTKFADTITKSTNKFSTVLLSNESISKIQNNPELLRQMQGVDLTDSQGQPLGKMFDENGKVNKLATLDAYQTDIAKSAPLLFKNSSNKISEFTDTFVKNILKTYYRGDMIKDPAASPTHLVTQNGIFPLSDSYFDEIVKSSTVSLRPSVVLTGKDNIKSRKDRPSEVLNKFATVVEQTEPKEKEDINSLFIQKDSINPLQAAMDYITNNMDFDINVSLLPGFKPNDLNTIQYNYVRINGKTIKIPVDKTDTLKSIMQEDVSFLVNEILVEALTNNFVLSSLVYSRLLTHDEATLITNPKVLNEDDSILKSVYSNVLERAQVFPDMLLAVYKKYGNALVEAKKRNYKMEYRNYHGKPKQRKERAARTKAREQMIKKGKVRKGDGKDIDHKKPLRNGGSHGINNLRIRDRSDNRSDNGHKKGEKQDKDWK